MTCRSCNGLGATPSTRWDWGYDECPDCVGQQQCPVCGSFLPESDVCPKCEWRWDEVAINDELNELPFDHHRMILENDDQIILSGGKIA